MTVDNSYAVSEDLARHAKEMNSFSDYTPGSATSEYRSMVDEAKAIAEQQKERVDAMYHEKIDRLLAAYYRKLAENLNDRNRIMASVPSVLIAGPANFPARKKEKQNEAYDRKLEEYGDVQNILDRICGTGTGGISADDPEALDKLRAKLEKLQANQSDMKKANAYYRKFGSMKGYADLSSEAAEQLDEEIKRGFSWEQCPYPSFTLTNNNANIRRISERIRVLENRKNGPAPKGWKFNGGEVVMNVGENRVQILFDEKPTAELRSELKSKGFRWAPSQNAWQRQLNSNGIYAAHRIEAIKPIEESE
ncbi:MAG: DUF3560 domain-containing protein [Oscillospiraceae bacterium]|jgi:hypothetical protein|nr:DUF3560 domain-containing protein [Oscillospiraceae bacterium]